MKAEYIVWEQKHNIFHFSSVFKLLEVLFIMKLYAWLGRFTKIICI